MVNTREQSKSKKAEAQAQDIMEENKKTEDSSKQNEGNFDSNQESCGRVRHLGG